MSTMLSPDEVKSSLKEEAAVVERWLHGALRRPGIPPRLLESMEYSLHAGGKRIRPVLCIVAARMCGLEAERVLPFAGALECIHTYSLIHDDLPAMDDDDLRRGKPSCHKRFDEATAILAGDGLLTDAFLLMAGTAGNGVPADRVLRAIQLAAEGAGASGMVGGQVLDMEYTGKSPVSLEEVALMQSMKTGAMLRVPCQCGAVLAGADEALVQALTRYGAALGAAFQITDDILDETGTEEELGKPVGSDAGQAKNTYPSLVGLQQSRAVAAQQVEEAVAALRAYDCPSARLLKGLAAYILNRVS